ncbi:hypothetical protein [Citricoccus muralis]|uniref:Uncharacterized protein n=1 Tax=Citricoccus muralis TaxID=169134 RepID=A0A3D9LE26_9MICC|nr:hypothetical protein [Citricoccus muralis]REE04628.1 hypothetical protein C8E99_2468 [Citricoccus muralis]
MASFWDYFSVLAPSVGLALIFWLVMRSVFRVDTGERQAKAELEEREAQEWARQRAGQGSAEDRQNGSDQADGVDQFDGSGRPDGRGQSPRD